MKTERYSYQTLSIWLKDYLYCKIFNINKFTWLNLILIWFISRTSNVEDFDSYDEDEDTDNEEEKSTIQNIESSFNCLSQSDRKINSDIKDKIYKLEEVNELEEDYSNQMSDSEFLKPDYNKYNTIHSKHFENDPDFENNSLQGQLKNISMNPMKIQIECSVDNQQKSR